MLSKESVLFKSPRWDSYQLIFNLTSQYVLLSLEVCTRHCWLERTCNCCFIVRFFFDPNYSLLCFHWPIINCHFARRSHAVFHKLSHEYSNWSEWMMRRRWRIGIPDVVNWSNSSGKINHDTDARCRWQSVLVNNCISRDQCNWEELFKLSAQLIASS